MSLLPLSTSLLLATAGASLSQEVETRLHDFRWLLGDRPPLDASLDLLPLRAPDPIHGFVRYDVAPWKAWGDTGDVAGIIQQLIEPEWWEEDDASISGVQGLLCIHAPTDVHDGIESLLVLLQESFVPRDVLHVRVIRGEGLPSQAMSLDRDSAATQLRELGSRAPVEVLRSGSAALFHGGTSTIDDTRSHQLTLDWEVEIAMASCVFDPWIGEVSSGLEVLATTTRRPDGAALDLAVRFSEFATIRRRQVQVTSIIGARQLEGVRSSADPAANSPHEAVQGLQHTLTIESPEFEFFSFAGSVLLRPGKVLWIPMRGPSGVAATMLELSIDGPQRSRRHQVLADDPSRPFDDTARHDPGTRILELVPPDPGMTTGMVAAPLEGFHGDELGLVHLSTSHTADLHESLLTKLLDAEPEVESAEVGAHRILSYPARLRGFVDQALATVQLPQRQLRLHGALITDDAVAGEFSIPVTTGRPASVWGGRLGTFLAEWDVDVANHAIVGNPEIATWLAGCALRFRVHTVGPRALQLEINGLVHALGPTEELDYRSAITPLIERAELRRLRLQEIRTLGPEDLGEPLLLGDRNMGLELRLEEWTP